MQVCAPFFKHANSLLSQKRLPRLARIHRDREAVPIAALRSFRIDFREKQSELRALFKAQLVFDSVDPVVKDWWNMNEPRVNRQNILIWEMIARYRVSMR